MITPILKDPRPHGGTLYTFPSASRDLTRAFSNSEYEFAFSHFACLNLPDFRYGTFEDGDRKGVYLDNLAKYYYSNTDLGEVADDDADSLTYQVQNSNSNKCLKWHMQSYVMNYEVAILNGFSLDAGRYDNEILRNPSERIFFNWLQKVGAIKFGNNSESSEIQETLNGYGDGVQLGDDYDGILGSVSELENADRTKRYKIGYKLYIWKGGEWRSRILLDKTVQYIGTIDMVNNVNIDYDSFNEIYLNIPAGVGRSTDVYFYNSFDNNYKRGTIIDVKKDSYCDNKDINRKFIIGRNGELNMSDEGDRITLNAIYDSKYDINDMGDGKKEIYFDSPIYKIDNGYCINFNEDAYVDASGRVGLENMNLRSQEDFEFNCILIYYRIRKGNGQWYTNLYGVLFLEEVTISGSNFNEDNELSGYIQRYPKFKDGNSWGLKLDLKIDAQPDSQMELRSKLYDDPNESGIGMQMFTEALIQLNDCVKIFYEVKEENTEIEERLYKLENIVSGVDTVYDLRDEIGELRTRVEMFQPSLNSLVGRMESIEERVTSLETKFGYLIKELDVVNKRGVDLDGKYKKMKEDLDDIDEFNLKLDDRLTELETVFDDNGYY